MFSAGAGTQLVGTGLLTRLGFEAFRCSASTSGGESRTRLPQRMKSLWAPVTHSIWGCVERLVSGMELSYLGESTWDQEESLAWKDMGGLPSSASWLWPQHNLI